jgi:hypothetical protein
MLDARVLTTIPVVLALDANKCSNIERVRWILGSDRRKLWTKFSSVVGISVGSCHGILLDVLNVRHVCEHVVPRMLTSEQKERRTNISNDLIGMGDKKKTN